ncbi:LuxR C-terminal-related transcriptional regulator [Agromyces soli]
MDPETRSAQAPRHRSTVESFEQTAAVVELLGRHRLEVAPHVAARLGLELAGDADAIIEVADTLRLAQRLGHEALPDPLPLVPAVAAAARESLAPAPLEPWELRVLLAAAVCIDDRTEALLAVAGHGMPDFIRGGVSRHLLLVAGHFAFADPRLRIAVHGEATLAERTEVHAALAEAYDSFGDRSRALWHRSLATLEGDHRLAGPLIEFARRSDASGDTLLAHAVAREAASHAVGAEAAEAELAAGEIALHGGCVADAATWFGGVLARGSAAQRARALVGRVLAATLLTGDVPDAELDTRLAELECVALDARTTGSDATAGAEPLPEPEAIVVRTALVEALALAAGLHAERGAQTSARRRLDQASRLARRADVSLDGVHAAARWCAVFDAAPGPVPFGPVPAELPEPWRAYGVLGEAICAALDGDGATGLRALTALREARLDGDGARIFATPLERAAAAVVAALIELWQGEIDAAARRLRRSATDLPVVLPLAGLGAALLRRIEVIVDGRRGAFGRALDAAAVARGQRGAEVVDRAIAAYLDGRDVEASTLAVLAADDTPRDREVLRLPGLDEAVPATAMRAADSVGVPSDARLAAELRLRVRAAGTEAFAAVYDEVVARAREIVSPYQRARTELVLAERELELGDRATARRHLVTADILFRQAGATAWRRRVAARLAASSEDASTEASAPTEPISVVPTRASEALGAVTAPGVAAARAAAGQVDPAVAVDDDPLACCREVWADTLTERELEVAMLVVEGASNREAAGRLYVSVRTVEVHVGRVFTKLGVHSRVELAVLAHRMSRSSLAQR